MPIIRNVITARILFDSITEIAKSKCIVITLHSFYLFIIIKNAPGQHQFIMLRLCYCSVIVSLSFHRWMIISYYGWDSIPQNLFKPQNQRLNFEIIEEDDENESFKCVYPSLFAFDL